MLDVPRKDQAVVTSGPRSGWSTTRPCSTARILATVDGW